MKCAGKPGTSNADWCEDHKVETGRLDVLGVLTVVDSCYELRIHITRLGSACMYTFNEEEF
ncbi:uncharacterized protein K489DRAFT_382531 [Dissoconium aciculare CBS 342.82]|uniref:Uncharacterized protein n=1 Tax=Dissoconium aciculare CBS 342.82 TaxID=1314786 RepID=A0A6J3LZ96_9PEZI|nr:uncharacterized protein K489DRAFT_382531 [Dissoconium aciculare CBS 342.82]KAF1820599.1 hypothetical protein K489DRAFT_382531 [Dissoconium aciculare CBS 342.82]